MKNEKRIGVLGSLALDNIFNAQSIPQKGERVFGNLLGSCIGGMAANQAVEAARYSEHIYILGSVGRDEVGERIYDYLKRRGCKTDLLTKNEMAPTGQTYMFLVDQNKDYFSVVSLGANELCNEKEVISHLKNLDTLLVSLEMNVEAVEKIMEYANKHGIYVYLCPSPAEKCTEELMKKADAIIANRREAKMLLGIAGDSTERVIEELKELSFEREKLILISLGEEGAVYRTGEEVRLVKGMQVEPVDSVGAGDAFAGAFVTAREAGEDVYKACCYGCIAGGLTVSVIGAQSSGHTAKDVAELYRKYYGN